MKTKFTLLILTILGFNTLFTQNLVPNPGFETQTSCPLVSEIEKAKPWGSATLGTPDLFNSTCPIQNFPVRTGIGAAGIYVYSTFPNNREYLQVKLKEALISGNSYCFEFYVKPSNFHYTIDKIGAYFTTDSVYQNITSNLNFVPQVESNFSFSNANAWQIVEGEFIATGGEEWLILGNFKADAEVTLEILNASNTSNVAYFKIDDISLVDCTQEPIDTTTTPSTAIKIVSNSKYKMYPNPTFNELNIEITNQNLHSINIYNYIGEKIISESNLNNSYLKINTSKIVTGTYFIEIILEDNTILYERFIKH